MTLLPRWLSRVPGAAFLRNHWKGFIQGTTLTVAVLFLIKLTAADEWYWSKVVFYIPGALLAILGVTTTLAPGGFSWRARAVFLPLFLLLGGVSLWIEHPAVYTPGEALDLSEPELRVMTWNVMAYTLGEEEIFTRIKSENPDVFVLVEGTFRGRKPEKLAKALGPGYTWAVGNRLSIASRFPVVESRMLVQAPGATAFIATLNLGGGNLDVVAIDMHTPLSRRDGPAFKSLDEGLAEVGTTAIVSGDFNAPRGSRHLSRVFDGWRDDVLTSCDDHWQATWPSPAPLWQIDHSFSRGRVVPLGARIPWGIESDHLPLVIDYAISFPAP
ncbi:hypothetical protein GC173_09705 [bacterium]|nr:hypothetical protein [bacterium]